MDERSFTKAQRWALADHLAEERLPLVNAQSSLVQPSQTLYARYGKRVLDVGISAVALAVTLPLNVACGIGTYVSVGRPVFFTQERVGKDGKLFRVIKFRSMTNERDEKGDLLPASQRVTPFGRFMRKTSLDELFNFWSIFKGDMSVIGPRPLVPEYTHRYSDRHRMRLSVRPGLECPPRTALSGSWTWNDQFENDVWYVEHVSFMTDVRMLGNLVRFAINPEVSRMRSCVSRGTFMGYDLQGCAINFEAIDQETIDAFFGEVGER